MISVYESSFRFQSYIAQTWPTMEKTDAEHIVFTGDDCVLNPCLNAGNIALELGLDEDTGFIVEMVSINNCHYNWPYLSPVLEAAQASETYFSWRQELPCDQEMKRRFARHGLPSGPLLFNQRKPTVGRLSLQRDVGRYRQLQKKGVLKPDFPVAYGYSDLVIVPRKHVVEFVNYCRVFAAIGLFVEAAVPTALALPLPKVVTEKTSTWKSTIVWGLAVEPMIRPMERSMRKIAAAYRSKELIKHPVKLSAFENDMS